jgi:hypothetical protein
MFQLSSVWPGRQIAGGMTMWIAPNGPTHEWMTESAAEAFDAKAPLEAKQTIAKSEARRRCTRLIFLSSDSGDH